MSREVKFLLVFLVILLILLGVGGTIYFVFSGHADSTLNRANEKYTFGDVEDIKNGIELYASLANKKESSKSTVVEARYKSAEGYLLLWKKTGDISKLEVASVRFKKLISDYPESSYSRLAYLQIAHINLLEGNYDTALADLDVILTKFSDPKVVSEAYNAKGDVYYAIGDYDNAIYYYSRKENINSEYAMAHKGQAYIKLGRIEKALDVYEDFLKFYKLSPYTSFVKKAYLTTAYNYAFNQYKQNSYNKAVEYFQKIIDLFPDNPKVENAYYWIGECYYDQKNYASAIESFSDVLENRTSAAKDPDALLKLGLCYFEQDDFYKALKYFNNIMDNYPNSRLYEKAKSWKAQTVREIKYQ